MPKSLTIDFVSDVVCPWCVVGLESLKQAIHFLPDAPDIALTFQPFELNPHMGAEGQNLGEHIQEKYGISPQQSQANRQALIERGKSLGFDFNYGSNSRIWNTFAAHKLLHLAQELGCQQALKEALFKANFTDQRDISDRAVLLEVAASVGISAEQATEALDSETLEAQVRQDEKFWISQGINAVPAVVINRRYLISGGQPVEAFRDALANILEEQEA